MQEPEEETELTPGQPTAHEEPNPSRRIGALLGEAGKLRSADLDRALRAQREQSSSERIGSILIKLGLVSEREMVACLADQLGVELVTEERFPNQAFLEEQVSAKFLKENRTLILDADAERVVLVMADPKDRYVIDAIRLVSGRPVQVYIGIPSEIERAQERLWGEPETEQVDDSQHYGDDIQHLKELASEAPVIKLLNQVLQRAVEQGASDIHIEPFPQRLRVRYRIDGVLREVDSPPANYAAAVISRAKIMANLNIAERRLPQDGRMHLRLQGKELDLRISTVPALHGESLVMRILDRADINLEFSALGFSADLQSGLQRLLSRPHGILLVTGPTGSGKTTTLYTALEYLNTPERKILSVEDPIEYGLEGINQIQVKPAIGLTFAQTLRSLLRQDPDVLMIGEMRDQETAKIAVQSALTGHLVLSTLHTNDAVSSVTRLLDMGVEDYLLTSTLIGILAQRLVRNLCVHCREPYAPSAEMIEKWRLSGFVAAGEMRLFRARGCEWCNETGYAGRSCIAELLLMSEPVRAQILERVDEAQLYRVARQEGMRSLFESGLEKALAGQTSLEEVLRVTLAG